MGQKSKGKTTENSQSPSILSFFQRSTTSDAKLAQNRLSEVKVSDPDAAGGKGKARAIKGSEVDPVVISDDEGDYPMSTAPKRRKISPPLSIDLTIPGPSHYRHLQTSQPQSQYPSIQPPSIPFPAFPDFVPPASWPKIISTAHDNRDGSVLFDPEDDEDENRTQKLEDDDGDDAMNDDSGVELDPEEPIEILREESPEPAPNTNPLELDGMTWDEGDDEGMGMEEEGDDVEMEEVTPKPLTGEKVTECPVCGLSLKNKVNTIVQHHINACLDSVSCTPAPKRPQPITSIAHSIETTNLSSPVPEVAVKGPNAFSVLMSGHKEREQWKDAEDDLRRDGKRVFGRRNAPFYKVLTGMPIAVDAFRYGAIPKVTAYFLTHAHSDHYTNLSKSWKHGPIYCSVTTANLIIHMLGVDPQWVHGLPDDIPFEIPDSGGVTVTTIEANHCPGSSIFLFEGRQTVNAGDSGFASPYVGSRRLFRYLHCGDFRACPKHVLHPAVARARVDTCYLDTTYLNPSYCFPPQPLVIQACSALAQKVVQGVSDKASNVEDINEDIKPSDLDVKPELKPHPAAEAYEAEERSKAMMEGWLVKKESGEVVKQDDEKPKGRTLVLVGTYSIGKERIVKGIARALGSKVYCDPRKRAILTCEADPELHEMLDSDPRMCQVHLVPLGNIQLDNLQPYLHALEPHFNRILAFRPTGWTYSPPAGTNTVPDVNFVIRRDQARGFSDVSLKPIRGSSRQFMMYGVPYSEHSSFFELTCFALSMPGPELKMIATVNVGNEKNRAKMKKWFEKWLSEKARRKEKGLPSIVEFRDETFW